MKANSLLKLIPDKELEFLAVETKVDHQVKKLKGVSMFRLILYSMLNSTKVSLRIMEHYYNSATFKLFTGENHMSTKYNSLSDRIASINSEYFERIFYFLTEKFSHVLKENNSLIRFDSTMVGISSKLVNWGMKVGEKTNKKQIKYTVGLKGSLPCHVSIFTTPSALCEDNTIPPAILSYKPSKDNIVVFDRGVQSRKTFRSFTDKNIRFVTRIKRDVSYKIISKNEIPLKSVNSTVTIFEDFIVQLKESHQGSWAQTKFRLIKADIDETKEEICFLTNIQDLDPYEIAFIYKKRWDIEVFFKFLKQELNLGHLVSRNENGVKVMIYMTLILSILLITYKNLNKLTGYKISKLNFARDLEIDVIRDIVLLCGGNPRKMPHVFSDT